MFERRDTKSELGFSPENTKLFRADVKNYKY